jgi:hypothetical protein
MAQPASRRTCYLSRRRGWIDPENERRPASEVNLLAIALGSRVWTLDTAWASIFNQPVPRSVAHAYRKAMARTGLSEREIDLLREVAERLRIELVVTD